MNHENKIQKMFDIFFELQNSEGAAMLLHRVKLCIEEDREIIFCGVGKNFWMAEKLAATYKSLGIKSSALCPVHAIHGDMGCIKDQMIIFLSKSGTTKELLQFIKYLYRLQTQYKYVFRPYIVGVYLSKITKNIEWYNLLIYPSASDIYEFDERNLVPTLSINILQMFLDYIGVKAYEAYPELVKNFSIHHPAGNIGEITGEGVNLLK